MIELKLYRHREHKDIFLAKGNYSGGNADTPFYYATKDIIQAINDANKLDFENWMHCFEQPLKAKITVKKKFEFDGYKGTAEKELCFLVTEFELVYLVEKE